MNGKVVAQRGRLGFPSEKEIVGAVRQEMGGATVKASLAFAASKLPASSWMPELLAVSART